MKKILLLLLSILLGSNALYTYGQSAPQLYLVGSATDVGWNNKKAIPLLKQGNGMNYVWEGNLKAGEFKFITQLGTWKSAAPLGPKNEYIVPGYKHYGVADSKGDPKYIITEPGRYRIIMGVFITSLKSGFAMGLTRLNDKGAEIIPSMYLVGSATSAGWNNTKGIEMKVLKTQHGLTYEYEWKGYLKAGEFKFITKLGSWDTNIAAGTNDSKAPWTTGKWGDMDVTRGGEYPTSTGYALDPRFKITKSGMYTLSLNARDASLRVKPEAAEKGNVYLLGSATSVGENLDFPLEMKKDELNANTYTWTGDLKKGNIKFLSQRGTLKGCYSPIGNQYVIDGYTHPFRKDENVTNRYFQILDEANYTISFDTLTEKLKFRRNRGVSTMYVVGDATSIGWDGMKALEMESVGTPDSVVYKWKGFLQSGKFKFIAKKGLWKTSVMPHGDHKIRKAEKQSVPLLASFIDIQTDYHIEIEKSDDPLERLDGLYELEVNLSTGEISHKLIKNAPDMSLVGSATSVGWNLANPITMTQSSIDDEKVYTWTGDLKKGAFRLMLDKTSLAFLTPMVAEGNIIPHYLMEVKVGFGDKSNFVITEDANYTMTVKRAQKGSYTLAVTKNTGKSPVYIVGNATTAGWDNNKAMEMTQDEVSPHIYIWEGYLTQQGGFKFITQRGLWKPHIAPSYGKENVEVGLLGLDFNMSSHHAYDIHFKVRDNGYYKVTLDMATRKVTGEILRTSLPFNMYLIGDATSAGWNNKNPIAMTKGSTGSEENYTWTGNLKKGEFKFIVEPGTWKSVISSSGKNAHIIPGLKYNLTTEVIPGTDPRFIIPENGNYTIMIAREPSHSVDESYLYMRVTKNTGDMTSVYLVGSATSVGWNNTKAIKLEYGLGSSGVNVYKWTGYLKEGEFKYIARLGSWNYSINPASEIWDAIVDTSHNIFDLSGQNTLDKHFIVKTAGTYQIEMFLTDNTSTILYLPNGVPAGGTAMTALPEQGSVRVSVIPTEENMTVKEATLINLSGQILDTDRSGSTHFSLGNNIQRGVYIVRVLYSNGKIATQKVMIK